MSILIDASDNIPEENENDTPDDTYAKEGLAHSISGIYEWCCSRVYEIIDSPRDDGKEMGRKNDVSAALIPAQNKL